MALAVIADVLWGCVLAGLSWIGAAAGIAFGDWRDRRAGRPIDRGWHWAQPGDPDY